VSTHEKRLGEEEKNWNVPGGGALSLIAVQFFVYRANKAKEDILKK
jgi:hypothetical protein